MVEGFRDNHEELYRILTEKSFTGIYVVQNGSFQFINRNAASYAGYLPEELIGRNPTDIIHPEDRENARKNARAMLTGRKTSPSEFRVLAKDGRVRWIMETVVPITWEGKPAILGNSMDVSERKEFEEVLHDRQERFRILFERANDAIFIVEEYRFIDCNRKALTMFQCSMEQIIGQTIARFSTPIQPDGKDSIQKAIEKLNAALTGEPQFFEWRHCRLDGTFFEAEVSLNRLELPEKQLIQMVVRDISKRKQIERALRESEERFRSLIETTNDLVFIVNSVGHFTYVNPRFKELLGYAPQALIGKTLVSVIAPESVPEVMDRFKEEVDRRDVPAYEALLLHASGQRIPVEFVSTVLRDNEGKIAGRFSIGRDITDRKRAELALREDEEKYRAIFENNIVGMFQSTPGGRFISVNPTSARMYGYDSPQEMIEKVADLAKQLYVNPGDRDVFKRIMAEKGIVEHFEHETYRKDGSTFWVSVNAKAVRDSRGEILFYEGTHEDITQRKQAEDNLRQSEERYRTIIENIGDGYYEVNLKGDITFLNDASMRIIGLSRSEIEGRNFKNYATGEDAATIFSVFQQVYLTGLPFRGLSWRIIRPDSIEQHLEVSVSLIRDAAAQPTGFRGIIHDITERRRAEKAIQHMAYHDPLTGLPNRLLFYDRFSQILAHARRNHEHFAVIMLDLDKFKEINDRFGHGTGDQLLRAVAERLTSQMREGDTVARFGGDEFLLLLPGMKHVHDFEPLGKKVLQVFQQHFHLSDRTLHVVCSIGVAVYPDDGTDRDTLFQKADLAMYRAKAAGGNRWFR
jgi:diguanylate cyclase (GGDEF)-like protein/PAS domain S-box-containing protein